MSNRVLMNRRSKNLSMIGAVLAVTLFLCGLFHEPILAFWHSDDGAVAMEGAMLTLICLVLPAAVFATACWCIVSLISIIRKLLPAKQ